MLEKLRKERGDEGFTLIELLVVIIIIGILAAIAIPVFLNQRQKGWEAAVKSDLRNAATAQETYLTESNTYTDNVAGLVGTFGFKFSDAKNYQSGAWAAVRGPSSERGQQPVLLHDGDRSQRQAVLLLEPRRSERHRLRLSDTGC